MRALRRVVPTSISISLLLWAVAPAAQALDKPASVCQATVGKSLLGFKRAKIKAWTKCLDATLTGGVCDATARDAAVDAAAVKARAKLEAKCSGTLAFDATPAGVAFASNCQLRSGDLTSSEQACAALPVGTAGQLSDCLMCWKEVAIDRLLEGLYPCLTSSIPDGSAVDCGAPPPMCPDPITDKDEVSCLRAVSKATSKWFLAEEKALEKCLNAKRAGKIAGPCPDSKAAAKIATASQKAVDAIAGKCTALPSFWTDCPFDSSAPCDEPITTVTELSSCVVDGAGEIAEELVCEQYPNAAADGIACPSSCVPFSETDVCNGIDDDCDAMSADGSEDPSLGAPCDGTDGDLCIEGSIECTAGVLGCSDVTGTTTETCNGFDDDCDGTVDEGFDRDTNPDCALSNSFLGTVSGDTASMQVSAVGFDEKWYRVTVREDDGAIDYLSATVSLVSPPGVDFDLYVYCASCGGSLAGDSETGGLTGHVDSVVVRKDDNFVGDDTFDVFVEVRHFTSNVCASWSLDVFGDTTAAAPTCP